MAALIVLLISFMACAHGPMPPGEPVGTGPTPLDSSTDEILELRVGGTAAVTGTTASITFVRVVNDSRCPRGAQCVWEGDAVVELRVQPQQADPRAIELHTSQRFERQTRIDGVTVTLERLEPHPQKDVQVEPDAYRVTLRVGAN